MSKFRIEERLNWRWWVTPKPLRNKPIHRWCIFPHSFTSELVHGLIDEWKLSCKDYILDPFCGAGTTPLAAKEKGIPAVGYDISPFAVFSSNVKLIDYDNQGLEKNWLKLQKLINPSKWNGAIRSYPELVEKALPGHLLGAFDNINNLIRRLDCKKNERDFFKMALLLTLPDFSRAVATGGWLKWIRQRATTQSLLKRYTEHVEQMLEDSKTAQKRSVKHWKTRKADVRFLPDTNSTFSAVITSPPYPNRHDYTRVFGVELMFGFLDWEKTRKIRYQSFESHPEAHPQRPKVKDYFEPGSLANILKRIETSPTDQRISGMLKGYFLDIHLSLSEINRVCKKDAHIAFVVGNAQYGGFPVLVDELTAQIGENIGLKCEKIIATRYRGNSAQQMLEYGRNPSRESIVIFKKVERNAA